MQLHFGSALSFLAGLYLFTGVVGCASGGAASIEDVQQARGRVIKVREKETFPFVLKPTGDGSLDAIVGIMIQVSNEKVESMEKIVAAGSDNMFTMVNTRMEEEYAVRKLSDPTAEQRAQVREEISKKLSPEERKSLASACASYEAAAGAYKRDEKKNTEVIVKCVADLAAKVIAIKEGAPVQ